jgi:hypothetical protein
MVAKLKLRAKDWGVEVFSRFGCHFTQWFPRKLMNQCVGMVFLQASLYWLVPDCFTFIKGVMNYEYERFVQPTGGCKPKTNI